MCHDCTMNDFAEMNKRFRTRLFDTLNQHQPFTGKPIYPYASVLVPILLDAEPEVLLTVRAEHLTSHPGEVSFPGGMNEDTDIDWVDTAFRETREEVGVARECFEHAGQLSAVVSKKGYKVYPVVGLAQRSLSIEANEEEISEVFTVPWHFFAKTAPELRPAFRGADEFFIPHFYYEDKHIWGLTAMVLLELVNLLEGTEWPVPDFSKLAHLRG